MEQGGELYANTDILNVFTNNHYELYPTGLVPLIKMDQSNELTVLLVIMSVPC